MVKVIDKFQGLVNIVEGSVEEVQEMYRTMVPATFGDLVFEEAE